MSSTNPSHKHADDTGGLGMPSPDVIARGYEADTYDTRTVLSVPLLVILFFVLAFITVTILFSFIAYPDPDPMAHPGRAAKNKEPLNERLMQNYRGPKDGTGQPRLEPLKLRTGDPRAISTTELPVEAGNSPEYHPEDLIPTKERYPELFQTGNGKVGLDVWMTLDNDTLKHLFPTQATPSKPANSLHRPTGSNAGRGSGDSAAILPPVPPLPVLTAPTPPGGKP